MSHRNTRTAFQARLLIVRRHRADWPQPHIAAAMGTSRKCVKTWLDRFAVEGEAGLHDRSSRPHTIPAGTAAEAGRRIVKLRRRERRGLDWIGAELGVPALAVSRALRRHQLPHLAAPGPLTGKVIRASKATAVRYEKKRPGELVHRTSRNSAASPAEAGKPTAAPSGKPPATGPPRPAPATSTPWPATTPGWPTPRSCPMRKARPACRCPPAQALQQLPTPQRPPTRQPQPDGQVHLDLSCVWSGKQDETWPLAL